MEQHLFPAFGKVSITKLRAPDILPTLREIEARGNNETAKRLRQYCEAVFTFAISTGIAERNVGADLRGALAPCRATNRPAIIDPKGVAQLLRAIDGYQGSPVVLAALRLAPLVFVRPGELRQAEWSEIDLEAADGPRWSIPAEKMKMRRDHIVPLSKQAVEIITELFSLTGQDRYLFPCNRTNGRCMENEKAPTGGQGVEIETGDTLLMPRQANTVKGDEQSERRGITWTPKRRKQADEIITVVNSLSDYWPLTLRQIYYRLVAAGIVANTRSKYNDLSKITKQMRLDGMERRAEGDRASTVVRCW